MFFFVRLALLCASAYATKQQLRTAWGAFETNVPADVDFTYSVTGSCVAKLYKLGDLPVIDVDYDFDITSDEPLAVAYSHIHYVNTDGSEPKFAWSPYFTGETSGNYGAKVVGGRFTEDIYNICMQGGCYINLHKSDGAGFARCLMPARPYICNWGTDCASGAICEPGTECHEYQWWSQCLEVDTSASSDCVSTNQWGCGASIGCCNSEATCMTDGTCRLSCNQ